MSARAPKARRFVKRLVPSGASFSCVEHHEIEVLEGVDAGDWGRIRQPVVEVQSDVDKTLRYRLRSLLDAKGFRVMEQDLPYVGRSEESETDASRARERRAPELCYSAQ